MGGIESALAVLPAVAQGVRSVVTNNQDRKERKLQERQLLANQQLQERQLQENAVREQQKIALDAQNIEAERKTALKRAVARQRANFGAQGVGSGDGSSRAVLLGLYDESDAERQRREELDNFRFNALDQDVSQRKSINVLERTQLAERNKLGNLSGRLKLSNDFIRIGSGFE